MPHYLEPLTSTASTISSPTVDIDINIDIENFVPRAMKILCLHGYTQSGPLFSAKTKGLQKALLKAFPAGTTFNFPTAPHKLKLDNIPGGPPPDTTEEDSDFWGWWSRNDNTGEYVGLSETFAFLSELLDREGPFDGIIGFSQGAALTGMLGGLLQPGGRDYSPDGWTSKHPPIKFAVCYSGFIAKPKDRYGAFYDPKIAIPVLHILGSLDTVVSEERSIELVDSCIDYLANDRVVYHPGGHYVPATKQIANVVIGFIKICTEPPAKKALQEGPDDDFEDMPF